jgi:hypothetical protein
MDSLLDKAESRTSRRRWSWLGALPLLAGHIARMMPWLTLIIGCIAGTAYLALLAHIASPGQPGLSEGSVRFAFLPAIAALAFVLRGPFRPLTHAVPIPAWLAPAAQVALALPVLAATCLVQLRIMTGTVPLRAVAHLPALYPLIAQLVAWCAVTVAVAAWVDRSRYADLGGAVAVPVSFAIIGLAWYTPASHKFLAEPPASAAKLTIAWYVIAAVALACSVAAMRDQWHRYTRRIRRAGICNH